MGKHKSHPVWNLFTVDAVNNIAICKGCKREGKDTKINIKSGKFGLVAHIKSCHKEEIHKITGESAVSTQVGGDIFTENENRAIALAQTGSSFRIVEEKMFCKMFMGGKTSTGKTMSTCTRNAALKLEKILHKKILGDISVTLMLDGATLRSEKVLVFAIKSRGQVYFYTLFEVERSTGEIIAACTNKVLKSIEDGANVTVICTDNEEANVLAMSICKSTRGWLLHSRCAMHSLNLFLGDVLTLEPYSHALEAQSKIQSYNTRSKRTELKKKQIEAGVKPLFIVKYVEVRFLSLHRALERSMKIRQYIDSWDTFNWEAVEKTLPLTKILHDSILAVEGDNSGQEMAIAALDRLGEFCKGTPLSALLENRLAKNFKTRYNELFFAVNPTSDWTQKSLTEKKELREQLVQYFSTLCVNGIFKEIKVPPPPHIPEPEKDCIVCDEPNTKEKNMVMCDTCLLWMHIGCHSTQRTNKNTKITCPRCPPAFVSAMKEFNETLKAYFLGHHPFEISERNSPSPQHYWEERACEGGYLAKLALILTSASPTEAPVERLFSLLRAIIGKERFLLSSQALSSLLFLKANYYPLTYTSTLGRQREPEDSEEDCSSDD